MKPVKVKPGMYALFFERLKVLARNCGYNLVLHGSLDRDMDMVAIPWSDEPKSHLKLLQSFQLHLMGRYGKDIEAYYGSVTPGGRQTYVINFNRGSKDGEWNQWDDEEYYLDISITPLVVAGIYKDNRQ